MRRYGCVYYAVGGRSMLKITADPGKNIVTVSGAPYFLGFGIIASFMSAIGVYLIVTTLPFEDGSTVENVLSLGFMLIWTLLTMSMATFAFSEHFSKIIIDSEGVKRSSLFSRKSFSWTEIADWGLSYCGQTRNEGNTYYFYFSDKIQESRNETKKRLRGKMIKMIVSGDEYSEIVNRVVPFCRERSHVEPFIGSDKFHLI